MVHIPCQLFMWKQWNLTAKETSELGFQNKIEVKEK